MRGEEDLPSPEELIPLSQSLITPNLSIGFDLNEDLIQLTPPPSIGGAPPPSQANSSAEDEPTRTLKRPRLVWTLELHKRFVDAVDHLGIKNAVPKTILQLMNVDGLTRENVASHLQKYRLFLNREKSGGGGGGNVAESNHLFASSDHFMPSFVPIPTLEQQQQIQATHPQFLHRQISAAMDQSSFLARQSQQQQQVLRDNYADDLESRAKTLLTLFPTRDH